jgi:hypothetical protein
MKPKPQSAEYRAFENMLGKVLTVTKAELNQRLEQEKKEKTASRPQIQNDKPAHR